MKSVCHTKARTNTALLHKHTDTHTPHSTHTHIVCTQMRKTLEIHPTYWRKIIMPIWKRN